MRWRRLLKQELAWSEPMLLAARQARDRALRMPFGDARDRLLDRAEANELAVIDRWLAPLNAAKR